MIIGDKLRLKQILINLVKNALKFTKEGYIKLVAAYDDVSQLLLVHVIDNGKGIADQDMAKLFKMFGKLRRTAELNSEGLGMGLMICQKLVELNKGTISVKSDGIDKGSVFTFTMDMKRVPQYSIEDENQPYNSKKLNAPNKDYAELLEEDKEEYD